MSRFYGFPVHGFTSAEKLAYQLAMPALEADEVIERHGGSLSADDLHDLILKSTGSKSAAERAFIARRKAELKSGLPVAG